MSMMYTDGNAEFKRQADDEYKAAHCDTEAKKRLTNEPTPDVNPSESNDSAPERHLRDDVVAYIEKLMANPKPYKLTETQREIMCRLYAGEKVSVYHARYGGVYSEIMATVHLNQAIGRIETAAATEDSSE